MEEQKKVNFLDIHKNEKYKKEIIKYLSFSIKLEYIDSFKYIMEYVIDEKYSLFDIDELKGVLYEDEDEILDLILPAIRRVFSKIYISPPTLLKHQRLKLFQAYFNIDEFIDYLIEMLLKCKNVLENFIYLDKTIETLTLIVDNYIAELVKRVKDVNDISVEIRDLRIKKIIK